MVFWHLICHFVVSWQHSGMGRLIDSLSWGCFYTSTEYGTLMSEGVQNKHMTISLCKTLTTGSGLSVSAPALIHSPACFWNIQILYFWYIDYTGQDHNIIQLEHTSNTSSFHLYLYKYEHVCLFVCLSVLDRGPVVETLPPPRDFMPLWFLVR